MTAFSPIRAVGGDVGLTGLWPHTPMLTVTVQFHDQHRDGGVGIIDADEVEVFGGRDARLEDDRRGVCGLQGLFVFRVGQKRDFALAGIFERCHAVDDLPAVTLKLGFKPRRLSASLASASVVCIVDSPGPH